MKTPNVKLLIHALLVLTITRADLGDVMLGGPGVPVGQMYASGASFSLTYSLLSSYKFVMTGLEAKGNVINYIKGDKNKYTLVATVSSSVGNSRTANLIFKDIATFNASPLISLPIAPAVIFKASNTPITFSLKWNSLEGSDKKASGTFNILGEYQKDPPKPVGSLIFSTGKFVLNNPNAKPSGTATITRE